MASTTVQEHNFTAYQGADLNATICLTESDSTATDLTGYAVRGSVKHRYGDSAALLDLAPTVATPATDGYIKFAISSTLTAPLPVGQFVYDIEKYPTNNANAVDKVLKGYFNVEPEATT